MRVCLHPIVIMWECSKCDTSNNQTVIHCELCNNHHPKQTAESIDDGKEEIEDGKEESVNLISQF